MFTVVHAQRETAWRNLAFDEALVRAGPRRPTVWLWRNTSCVVLGRGQRAEREVDLPACSGAGVPVFRRGSGGGTVYHDRGNLNITLAVPTGDDPWEILASILLRATHRWGLSPRLGTRGLYLGGAKFSGFASLRAGSGALAHATLLCSTPAVTVTRYLTEAPLDKRPLDSERGPVTSLAAHGVSDHSVGPAVLAATAAELGTPRHRAPSPRELDNQQRLVHTRYGFGPWHLAGKTRANKEDGWTRQAVSTCTG